MVSLLRAIFVLNFSNWNLWICPSIHPSTFSPSISPSILYPSSIIHSITHPSIHHPSVHPSLIHPLSIIHSITRPSILHPSVHPSFIHPLSIIHSITRPFIHHPSIQAWRCSMTFLTPSSSLYFLTSIFFSVGWFWSCVFVVVSLILGCVLFFNLMCQSVSFARRLETIHTQLLLKGV
jgi:hypothetical protein